MNLSINRPAWVPAPLGASQTRFLPRADTWCRTTGSFTGGRREWAIEESRWTETLRGRISRSEPRQPAHQHGPQTIEAGSFEDVRGVVEESRLDRIMDSMGEICLECLFPDDEWRDADLSIPKATQSLVLPAKLCPSLLDRIRVCDKGSKGWCLKPYGRI